MRGFYRFTEADLARSFTGIWRARTSVQFRIYFYLPPRVPRTTRILIRTKWLLKLNQCNFSKSEQLLLKITGWCIENVFVVFAYFIWLFLNYDNCLLFTEVSVIVPQQSTSFNFLKSFSCAPNGHLF